MTKKMIATMLLASLSPSALSAGSERTVEYRVIQRWQPEELNGPIDQLAGSGWTLKSISGGQCLIPKGDGKTAPCFYAVMEKQRR